MSGRAPPRRLQTGKHALMRKICLKRKHMKEGLSEQRLLVRRFEKKILTKMLYIIAVW